MRLTTRTALWIGIALVAIIALWPSDCYPQQTRDPWRDASAVMGAHVVFAGFDALLYPKLGEENKLWYRVTQLMLQGALSYALYEIGGWRPVIAFNVQWWTWNDDLLYYFFYDLMYGRTAFKDEVLAGRVTWAGWTPAGLIIHGGKRERLSGNILLTQAGVGLTLGFAIIIF